MLGALRTALRVADGRPLRLEALARDLGVEPAVLRAAWEHGRQRGLLADAGCAPSACAAALRPACRRCPLAGQGEPAVRP
jgi:hypothetical protein